MFVDENGTDLVAMLYNNLAAVRNKKETVQWACQIEQL